MKLLEGGFDYENHLAHQMYSVRIKPANYRLSNTCAHTIYATYVNNC